MFRRQRRKLKRFGAELTRNLSASIFRRSRKLTRPLGIASSVFTKLFVQIFDTNNLRFLTRPVGAISTAIVKVVTQIATGISGALGRATKNVGQFLDSLVPRTLLSILAGPIKAIGRFLGTFLFVIWAPIRDQLIKPNLGKWFVAKLKPLWYPFYLLGNFFAKWFK